MNADIVKISDATFNLEGSLGFDSVGAISNKAKQLFSNSLLLKNELAQKEVVFNCEKLEHCDSACIALLIEWKKFFNHQGIKMRFVNLTNQMQSLVNLMELNKVFA